MLSPTRAALALSIAIGFAPSCATSAPTSVASDPAWADARGCLAEVTWIDRVDGGRAVALGPTGEAWTIPLAALPPGSGEGTGLVAGAPSPRCEARIRAYVRALRAVNANAGDTSSALRLD